MQVITRREALSAVASMSLVDYAAAAVRIDPSPDIGDYTDIFATAIEKASANGSGMVWIPAGQYNLRKLVLRSGVILCGAGRRATVLKALPSEETSLITLTDGPVVNAGMRDLAIEGGENPEQWAFHIASAPAKSGKPHGGLWWSSFEEISIRQFDRGIWLQGGNEDYMLPHQFLSLSKMSIDLASIAMGPCLRITGQVNQTTVTQVYMDAPVQMTNSAVEIFGHTGALTSPKMLQFEVVTIQNAALALYIQRAQNIKFSSCWFEELDATARVEADSMRIQFDNCRFANAGRKGVCIYYAEASSGAVSQSIFAGDNKICYQLDSQNVSIQENDYIWGSSPPGN